MPPNPSGDDLEAWAHGDGRVSRRDRIGIPEAVIEISAVTGQATRPLSNCRCLPTHDTTCPSVDWKVAQSSSERIRQRRRHALAKVPVVGHAVGQVSEAHLRVHVREGHLSASPVMAEGAR